MARRILLAALALTLAACSGRPRLEERTDAPQSLVLEAYFDGQLTAWGQFQDRFGTVRRSFVVAIQGEWDGETLTLTEDFVYEDESREQRVWRLRKTGANTWAGTAASVVGEAVGEVRGDAFNWRYTIDLQTPDGPLRASFDDWMWLQADGNTLINRAYMSKYGFDIGEVIIFFQKDAGPRNTSGKKF